jgi:hypothetical protein
VMFWYSALEVSGVGTTLPEGSKLEELPDWEIVELTFW